MKVSWNDTMRNDDVLKLVKEDHLQCRRRMVKHKLFIRNYRFIYAGHILRGSTFYCFGWQNLRKESKGTAKKNVDG